GSCGDRGDEGGDCTQSLEMVNVSIPLYPGMSHAGWHAVGPATPEAAGPREPASCCAARSR
ncbi:MAG TPA: hypothetical protein VJ371_03245, partial [Streptosporangiaceae bacterium]|nr:hypothetical protein [Streptosporangiaceae bacterium]